MTKRWVGFPRSVLSTLTASAVLTLASAAVAEAPPAPPLVCTAAATQSFTGATGALADNATTTFTVDVSGVPEVLWDVDLGINLAHTFPADLDVTLTSPHGTTVLITSDNGGNADDIFDGTIFDDQADPDGQVPYLSNAGMVTDQPYINNQVATPLAPEGALGAFVGEDPNGTWTLAVVDDLANDVGTLSAFSLTVTALDDSIDATTSGTFVNATPVSIPNSVATVTSAITVSGLTDPICGVDVVTNIRHTFGGDLDITVQSPAGTVVTLTTDNGGSADDVFNGTRWDDDADANVADTNFMLGIPTTLVPEEALTAFTGEAANGTWTLTVSDDQGGDAGVLSSWLLQFETCRAADQDDDGKSDKCDNCPSVPNASQADRDNDDDGDACDCGDGLEVPGEECDDGNNDDGDGCDSSCHDEASSGGGGEGGGGGEDGQTSAGGSAGTGGTGGTAGNGTAGATGTGTAGEGGEGGELTATGGTAGSGTAGSGTAGSGTAGGAGGVVASGGSAGTATVAGAGGSNASGGLGGSAGSSSGGKAGSSGRRPATSKEDGGCGCRVPAGGSTRDTAWLFASAALALTVLRRKKRG